MFFKNVIRLILNKLLLGTQSQLVNRSHLQALYRRSGSNNALEAVDAIFSARYPNAQSYGQLKQDIIALLMSGMKSNGYFVEFGAANGLHLSNTAMLERDFHWTGILSEPAIKWHAEILQNRNCILDKRCVWTTTGETIKFNECEIGELSTIAQLSDSDFHAERRVEGRQYSVDTVSLNDLLDDHKAPEKIDYLSIDTEGSEFEILKNFDFSNRKIKFISCEHNYTENRGKINKLLSSVGYRRVLTDLSSFDDWYILDGQNKF